MDRIKMAEQFTYKGFSGSADVSIDDDCLHGRILFIDDLITYEGEKTADLKSAFELAVDEYLEYCLRQGKQPCKPYSGSFNVRPGPALHRKMAELAYSSGCNLNEFVTKTFQDAIDGTGVTKIEHTHTHLINITDDKNVEVKFVTANEEQQWRTHDATTRLQ